MVNETDSDVLFAEEGVVRDTGILIVGVDDSDFCRGDLPGVEGLTMKERKTMNKFTS